MNVLITGHGADRDAVDAARNLAPYRKLVLVTSDPNAPDVAALEEAETLAGVRVDVRAVAARDLLGAFGAARNALDTHAKDRARVHVAGGPNLVASGLLLAAFHAGVEAFWCHARGVTRLPIAAGAPLEERFTLAERAALARLDARARPVAAWSSGEKRALVALRQKGLALADAREARLTPVGVAMRDHVVRRGIE